MGMEVTPVMSTPAVARSDGGGRQTVAAGGNSPPVQVEIGGHAADQVEAYLRAHDQSVRFQVDRATGLTIVHVYENATGELVRQIPTEEIVRIARFLQQMTATPAIDAVA